MNSSSKSDPKEQSTCDAVTSAAPAANGGDGDGDDLPSHHSPYEMGEIVIARHMQSFYEAKVEKVEFHEHWRYLIHYRGWKKRWDEWVGTDRLLKATEENSQKLSHPGNQINDKFNIGGMSGTNLSKSFDGSVKRQKNSSSLLCHRRKKEHFMAKGKDNGPVEKLVNISIPPMLKKQLVDDFEFINQMGKLVKLPRTPNVDDILEKYRDCRAKKEGGISASTGEVLSGLRVYFIKALPVMLLYNKERQQYQEVIADNVSPSAVYGAEHLLRLFVKLPALLYNLSIEEETSRELQQNLLDILKFLQKNQSVFFVSTYHVPEDSGRSTSKDDD